MMESSCTEKKRAESQSEAASSYANSRKRSSNNFKDPGLLDNEAMRTGGESSRLIAFEQEL